MSAADEESLAPKILATLWSLVAVSAVFISLKIFARVRRRVQLWWDDYVMLLSWVCLCSPPGLTNRSTRERTDGVLL